MKIRSGFVSNSSSSSFVMFGISIQYEDLYKRLFGGNTVLCPSCDHDEVENAKFCPECGAKYEGVIPDSEDVESALKELCLDGLYVHSNTWVVGYYINGWKLSDFSMPDVKLGIEVMNRWSTVGPSIISGERES